MFENFSDYKYIFVTGAQRSGTTIAARMIAESIQAAFLNEAAISNLEKGYPDKLSKAFDLARLHERFVLHCPALSLYAPQLATIKDSLIVWCNRDKQEILASQERIGWAAKWEKVELANYGRTSGCISDIKKEAWSIHKTTFRNWKEINYPEDIKQHPLYLEPELRKDFAPKQLEVSKKESTDKPNIAITLPLSGKGYCWHLHSQQVERLLLEKVGNYTICVLDNSNNNEFSERVQHWLTTTRVPFLYEKRDAPTQTIENVGEDVNLAFVMEEIYKKLFLEMAPTDTDFILNIEDDVICTHREPLKVLLNDMRLNPKYSSISALIFGRRTKALGYCRPQTWNFTIHHHYPENLKVEAEKRFPKIRKGLKRVGATSDGYRIIRYNDLKHVGVRAQGMLFKGGPDIQFGYDAMRVGCFVGVNYDLECDHWYIDDEGQPRYINKLDFNKPASHYEGRTCSPP